MCSGLTAVKQGTCGLGGCQNLPQGLAWRCLDRERPEGAHSRHGGGGGRGASELRAGRRQLLLLTHQQLQGHQPVGTCCFPPREWGALSLTPIPPFILLQYRMKVQNSRWLIHVNIPCLFCCCSKKALDMRVMSFITPISKKTPEHALLSSHSLPDLSHARRQIGGVATHGMSHILQGWELGPEPGRALGVGGGLHPSRRERYNNVFISGERA